MFFSVARKELSPMFLAKHRAFSWLREPDLNRRPSGYENYGLLFFIVKISLCSDIFEMQLVRFEPF